MTVMSEGLLLNSKCIKMGLICHAFNHLAVIHLWFCNGLKNVGTVFYVEPGR